MQANPGIQRRCARRFGDLSPKQGTHGPAAGSTNCDPPDVWPQFGVSGGLWSTGPYATQDAPLRLGCISAPASISRQGARSRLPSLQSAGWCPNDFPDDQADRQSVPVLRATLSHVACSYSRQYLTTVQTPALLLP